MGRKRFRAEQIIGHLREADVKISQGVHMLDLPGDGDRGADVLSVGTRSTAG
jgi:hypothetical protein